MDRAKLPPRPFARSIMPAETRRFVQCLSLLPTSVEQRSGVRRAVLARTMRFNYDCTGDWVDMTCVQAACRLAFRTARARSVLPGSR